ncbi:MAG: hypothetical protein HZC04_00450 [Candidatus Lloydbacteria bacterium]|nr:hypothetical protein [Candidatus Lloydbacteria bacterium]
MKKIALMLAALCFFCVPNTVFGDSPKTDKEWDTLIVSEKLERVESAFDRIVGQEKFLESAYYSYGQLLRAAARAPIGAKTFSHEENSVGVFEITTTTELQGGKLLYIAHIAYQKKQIAEPLYDATLVWNVWSNESDNKTFILHIFSAENAELSVSRLVRFPIEDNLLGSPVFVFIENLGGMYLMTASAEDRNQDGIVDFVEIREIYLNVEKKITAKKLGGSFSGGALWNDVEVCENGKCEKMKLG